MTASHPALKIRCRLFARYAEVAGVEVLDLELAAPATVAEAVSAVRARLVNENIVPARPLVAINQEHATLDRQLADGDELAFLPPLAGG